MYLLISIDDYGRRKMRGMEIANTIGNPSAKAVSIKRLNKLAYKVRSQTNIDQWHTTTGGFASV